jgi:esterase/lipase superfamily enzyme
MHIEEHGWHSPRLDRDMQLKVYGHWGAAYIVFPCSRGRYYDYETMGMVGQLADFLEVGRIKLFTVDSVDAESWYNFAVPPAQRNARHEAYDRYVTEEVVPFVREHCRQPQLRPRLTGCSMGALHAVNFFLKHPDVFDGTLALSGLYRLDRPEFALGPGDLAEVYFNSPLAYLQGLRDPWYLERYREGRIVVCVGQGAWEDACLQDTRDLKAAFDRLAVPAWVDFWGPEVNHDWPWWYRQMRYFLGVLHGSPET